MGRGRESALCYHIVVKLLTFEISVKSISLNVAEQKWSQHELPQSLWLATNEHKQNGG